MGELVRRDALAGIGHAEGDVVSFPGGRDGDRPPARGVTQGVRYEVRDDLTDPDGVDVDDREALLRFDDERDTGLCCLRAEGGFGGLEQLARLEPLPVEPERSRLGVREQLEIVQETTHHARLVGDLGEVVGARLVDPVGHPFDVRSDHGQRRPELVCDVGEQVPPLFLVRFEPFGHAVERASEVAHVGRSLYGRARREVALGDLPRCIHHPADRPGGPADRAPERHEPQDQQHGEDEEPREEPAMVVTPSDPPSAERGAQPSGDEDEQEEQSDPDRDASEEPTAHRAPALRRARREGFVGGPPRGAEPGAPARAAGAVMHRRTDSRRRAPSGRIEASRASARSSVGCS